MEQDPNRGDLDRKGQRLTLARVQRRSNDRWIERPRQRPLDDPFGEVGQRRRDLLTDRDRNDDLIEQLPHERQTGDLREAR
jgi:hypothetical protein